jgi:hypothetical protein
MSLYRYVSAKDDLLLLMQEAGTGLPPLTIGEAADWRDGLTRWYRGVMAAYAEHPWMLDIAIDSEPNTPNNLAWLDAGLSVLVDTPLTQQGRVSALLLLSGQSRWAANILRNHQGPDLPADVLAELITPEQFPFLAPAIANGAFADNEQDAFEFGLLRILDGLQAHMAELDAGGPGSTLAPDTDPMHNKVLAKDERVRKANERVRDAEAKLRDARQKQREAVAKARERSESAPI